jgi:hypothetical protein
MLLAATTAALTLGLLISNTPQASVLSGVTAHEGLNLPGLRETSPTNISAQQKKKKRAVRVKAIQPQPYTSGWGGGWRAADPSFDQFGRPYQPPPGLACPVDLGYGRWGSCDDDF